MKELKFKFDLDSKVAIYVPSTVNVNESCNNSAMVRRVLSKLSELFGGGNCNARNRRVDVERGRPCNRKSNHRVFIL